MSINYNWYFLSSDIFLLLIILALLIFGVLLSTNKTFGLPVLTSTFNFLTLQTIFFSILILIYQIPISAFLWNGFLVNNYFTYFTKIILLFLSFGVSSISLPYLKIQKVHFFEYWVLLLSSILAISLVIQSFDLLSIYISIEFQSLIFYILASLNRTSEFSTEAGLKYFILGAFSSAFLLMGSVLLYSFSGITNLLDFSKFCTSFTDLDPFFLIGFSLGLIFILVAILFKFNSAPFHFWSPDVYDGVPFSVTSIFAILPKLALGGLLIKLLYFSFFTLSVTLNYFLITCSFLSSIIGILGAFRQTKWKRFIAYSSVGHSSFILLGLVSHDLLAAESIFIFLIIYSITSLLFFFITTNLCFFKFPNFGYLRFIQDTKNLASVNNVLSCYLLITMFSLAGVPPLAGFFSKFFILLGSIKNNLFGLSIFLIIINCLASFYYLRFTKLMFFDFKNSQLVLLPMNYLNSILTTFCVFFLILLILDLDFITAISKLMILSIIQ